MRPERYPYGTGPQCGDNHRGDEHTGDPVGQTLHGRFGRLCACDQSDDLGEHRVLAGACDDGRPRQGLSDATPGQNGFAGDHGLVDAGLAGQHDAVQRYALAGADHQQIAGLHAVDVDVLGLGRVEPSVAGCLAGGQILGQWRSDIEDVGDTWAQLDQ